ncbi:MAG: Cdc6/Cdc18 family protein, partial [Candidatus Aenigmatarchaeota archaeon]
MDMFKSKQEGEGILRAENYLTSEYTPNELPHREEEMEEIANSIRPMFKKRKPENLFIYGPPGTGKTSCVKHVQDELDNNTTATSVYVNAWNYDTRTSCYAKILHSLGVPFPRKGKPVDVLYDRIIETASKKKKLVIAIDEIDQLGAEKSKTLYDLVRIDKGEEDFEVAVIVIGYKADTLTDLDSRARSSLSPKTLEYSGYKKHELIDILNRRVEKAFRQG